MNDAVDHPKHYTSHCSGVEAIDIVERLDFCLGSAVKYCWRVGQKDDAIQDLRKSAWYLRRALEGTRLGHEMRRSYLICPALAKVIASEPVGSVLREVLQLIPERIFSGEPPRIADALARVEREIASRSRA